MDPKASKVEKSVVLLRCQGAFGGKKLLKRIIAYSLTAGLSRFRKVHKIHQNMIAIALFYSSN